MGVILAPVLLDIFDNDLEEVMEWMLRFAVDIKLGWAFETLEDRAEICRHLDKLGE